MRAMKNFDFEKKQLQDYQKELYNDAYKRGFTDKGQGKAEDSATAFKETMEAQKKPESKKKK